MISVLFFLVAIDFVIFDVEAAFLYPWVLVLREGGWPLFWAVMVFVALILDRLLVYIWRRGGLELDLAVARPVASEAAEMAEPVHLTDPVPRRCRTSVALRRSMRYGPAYPTAEALLLPALYLAQEHFAGLAARRGHPGRGR